MDAHPLATGRRLRSSLGATPSWRDCPGAGRAEHSNLPRRAGRRGAWSGKTACSLSSALVQKSGVAWCWRAGLPSSSGPAPSACSCMPWTTASFRSASRSWNVSKSELVAELACVFPPLSASTPSTQRHCRKSAIEPIGQCGLVLERSAPPDPSCLSSTTSTGRTPASEELLSYLLRHPPGGPVLLAVAFRPSQLPPRLETASPATGREGRSASSCAPYGRGGNRAVLERLSTGEPGGDLPGERRQPLLLEELARAIGQGSEAERQGPGSRRRLYPAGGKERPRRGASTALRACQALLEGASVAGDPWEVDTAASAGRMDGDEAEVLAAWTSCSRLGWSVHRHPRRSGSGTHRSPGYLPVPRRRLADHSPCPGGPATLRPGRVAGAACAPSGSLGQRRG